MRYQNVTYPSTSHQTFSYPMPYLAYPSYCALPFKGDGILLYLQHKCTCRYICRKDKRPGLGIRPGTWRKPSDTYDGHRQLTAVVIRRSTFELWWTYMYMWLCFHEKQLVRISIFCGLFVYFLFSFFQTVTPTQLNDGLPPILEAFHTRSQYLNCLKNATPRPSSATLQGNPALGKYIQWKLTVKTTHAWPIPEWS